MKHCTLVLTAVTATAFLANAQDTRRAAFIGGGDPGRGKCTLEVVVDGAAEVAVRGDTANVRTLSGQPSQLRRFDCTSPMPPNPYNFRFSPVDGRGRQTLIGDPRSGGPIAVRIDDPQGGADKYKFDLFWENGGGGGREGGRDGGGRDFGRRAFGGDDAVRVCREAIARQAGDRFGSRDVQFRRIAMDDNPGRNDWVTGLLVVGNRPEPMRFSCSVDFATGRIRSADIEARGEFRQAPPPDGNRAFQNCQRAVQDRLQGDGFGRVEFRSIAVADRPDRLRGSAVGYRRDGSITEFDFFCSVEARDGNLRDVEVRRR